MFEVVNFGSLMTNVFLTDYELSHVYWYPKSKKVHGTFGLGWKYNGLTVQAKSNYGDVREISADDYVAQVNKAGEGVWVVLHLYKQGVPLCALINQYMVAMAVKFPTVKFLRSISTTCIPNYPDQNLPTCFVYFEGELKVYRWFYFWYSGDYPNST